ncbi:MAG: hypothetical protein KatS3mg004_3027 [Bryobacteraceae bacterium]|nr:MAG: hypothetical protein KatS3mg004_3027 [Bryobacteraceae bacterium]
MRSTRKSGGRRSRRSGCSRAQLLMLLYTIRSERMLVEQLRYNLL